MVGKDHDISKASPDHDISKASPDLFQLYLLTMEVGSLVGLKVKE